MAEIDWTVLETRFPGKPDFIRRLVAATYEAHADDLAKLAQIEAARDFAALAQLAHKLKGICGNLAAARLAALAAETEAAARAGDAAAFARLPALAQHIETFLEELRAHLAPSPLQE